MNAGVGRLPFFGMICGQLIAGGTMILRQPAYRRKLAANNNVPLPEWRLPEVIVGGVSFALGLFWLGWSGYRAEVHWIVPTLSGLLSGAGIMFIFLQSLNYLVDAYLMVCCIPCFNPLPSFLNYLLFDYSSPLLPSQQTHSCVRFVVLYFPCSQLTCSKVWAYSGLARC